MLGQVNPLRAKKLYVLAAMEVERYRKRTLSLDVGGTRANGTTTAEATAATLETLLKQDAEATRGGDGMGIASRTLDNAWHGAEAFHFFLLAQRQMYNGNVDQACVRALLVGLCRCMTRADVLCCGVMARVRVR